MTDQRPVGTTVRNWDLLNDGQRAYDDRAAGRLAWATDQAWEDDYPAEIVMSGGPNIVVHSRGEYEGIRDAMAQNARLAARNEP